MTATHQARNELVSKHFVFLGLVVTFVLGAAVGTGRAQEGNSAEKSTLCELVRYPGLASLTADKSLGEVARHGLPEECGLTPREGQRIINRHAAPTDYCQWDAFFCDSMRICHNPLYFEDRDLERYGRCKCLQAVRSTTLFATQTVLLPIRAIHVRPRACVSSPCATR